MKPLAITLGDPSGVGYEVVLGALELVGPDIPLWLFGDWNYAEQTLRALQWEHSLETTTDPIGSGLQDRSRLFVDVGLSPQSETLRFGVVDAAYGATALRSIQAGLASIREGFCSGLVTAPIHKQSLREAGSQFTGHTELLAAHAGLSEYGRDYAMYFDSPTLKVVLASVHVPLAEAILSLSAETITALAVLTHQEFGNLYGKRPEIGVAALNPHAGEGGLFGAEEQLIREGVEAAARHGLSISGPHPADTIFHAAREGRFDVVMAIYHDQGLIPVKTLHFEESVNVTLGLPFLRCSVDHGTAFDIAGRGLASPRPMAFAIRWAAEHL